MVGKSLKERPVAPGPPLNLPIFHRTSLGHREDAGAGVAAASNIVRCHLAGRVVDDGGGLLIQGPVWAFVVVMPTE